MKTNLKQPCKECPFRKKAPAGWLGPWNPEDIVRQISYGEFPCHRTIPHNSIENMESCGGAAMLLNNSIQQAHGTVLSSHQRKIEEEDHSTVFSNKQEFLDHHNNASVKSWNFK